MPITYRFDRSQNLLVVLMRGVITDEEILQYAKTATTDLQIPRPCDELIDLREALVPATSSDALRRVAAIFHEGEQAPGGAKVAFVASSDVAFGLARMYQAFRAGSKASLQVFRKMSEARAWLGLPSEPDEQGGC